jgi:hypothetical protein
MPECTPERYQQILARADYFWDHLDRSNPDICWEWTGRISALGYGVMKVNQKLWMAHRLAWILTHGPITIAQHVLHRCDNRPCCNPAHHFLGNQQINVADMIAKGRQASTELRSAAMKLFHEEFRATDPLYHEKLSQRVRGTKHWATKLTEDDIRRIRSLDGSSRQIAEQFGISARTIRKIRQGIRWAHVE